MLSQTQIIRSLGEALGWLEKELDWGAPLAGLRHLTGRIGEFYAAMLTRGRQMAGAVNQRGYDVVGFDGERIAVKTVTSSGRATFNPRTLTLVDRIIVLRISTDADNGVAIETLLDVLRADFDHHLRSLANGEVEFPIRPPRTPARDMDDQAIIAEAAYDRWMVRQYESGTVRVLEDGVELATAMPVLRMLAATLGVDLRNANGGFRNTRQLGDAVLVAMKSMR
ncbi:hypothetical protein SAMN05216382_0867 [Sphingomonas palmae]|uniref:Uncharacterized protein n=1 Tax=Sphingomonas palmae TaxID=1855283 RepID=A0A1H7IU76_9SPHN|nr:hypothetical protein [Sphingomonas palmae]SEK65794.1 hypothetical protein SAMN05216382_0867 [Sphingomonas palmae]